MTLEAFRVKSFRFQWPADLLTSWAFEMETFISLHFLGTLTAPMFGVLGDRLGGRIVLCALRAMYAVLAGMVPPAHVLGAVGLSRASADSARVAGALSGAGLSSVLGVGYAYLFVMLFYVASLGLTLGVSRQRPVPDPGAVRQGTAAGVLAAGRAGGSRRRDLKDGLVHVLTTPRLLAAMWLAFLINLTAYPASHGLLPYVAKHVYLADATGLGWLLASFALGGFAGSITMVATGGTRRPERTMLVYTAVWYALLLGFGHVESLGGGIVTLLLAGFVQNIALVSLTASLLDASGEGFRGRVMGVRSLAVYGLPIGLMLSGVLIERIGYPLTITASSLCGLVFTLLIGMRWRDSIWRAAGAPSA